MALRKTVWSAAFLVASFSARFAAAECENHCVVRRVDASCQSADELATADASVEFVATCRATCSSNGGRMEGAVDPTNVPLTSASGSVTANPERTGRSCDGAPVLRVRAPREGGPYFFGDQRLLRVDAPRTPIVVTNPTATPEPSPSPPRDWDDRRGFALELGAGPDGAWGGRRVGFGGEITLGLHDVRARIAGDHGEKFTWPEWEGLRWCATIACGFPLLLLFAPGDVLLGNDRGIDVHVAVDELFALDAPTKETSVRASIQPILRYARGSVRTGTLAGAFLPEIGWASGGKYGAVAFGWSLYPVGFLVDRRHLAVALDPIRAGLRIPLDGEPVTGELRTTLSFRWIR